MPIDKPESPDSHPPEETNGLPKRRRLGSILCLVAILTCLYVLSLPIAAKATFYVCPTEYRFEADQILTGVYAPLLAAARQSTTVEKSLVWYCGLFGVPLDVRASTR